MAKSLVNPDGPQTFMTTRERLYCFAHGHKAISVGNRVKEGMFAGFRIQKATHRIEMAKVECENPLKFDG